MSSEWLKVMLEEIARKKSEANAAQAELERRGGERQVTPSAAKAPAHAASGKATRDESPGGLPTGGRPPQ
jgi:hypothetical protein